MERKIVDLKVERIRRKLKLYERTGYIDDVLIKLNVSCAGEDFRCIIYHLKRTMHNNQYYEREDALYNVSDMEANLLDSLHTTHHQFKYPTILSQYKRGINPVIALHQEYQKSLLSEPSTHIDAWIIETVEEQINTLFCALEKDISDIEDFIAYIKENGFEAEPQIHYTLKRLKTAYEDFKNLA